MVLVFKTSVRTPIDVERARPVIDGVLPAARWNFDLDDSDNILCVASDGPPVPPSRVINALATHGVQREELAG